MITAIDLFSGAGGFTEGAKQAGVRVIWSANHWQAACDIHEANHPEHKPACQDLHQANFSLVPDHSIMLASSACQGHSRARGAERPHHDAMRSTAWAIVSAAEAKRPKAIVCENVVEFLKWIQYPAWKLALEVLGYTVTETILNAADVGVPQSRERVFVVASFQEIRIPKPSGNHIPAREIIDLDLNKNRWSLIEKPGRAPATLARISAGRERFGDQFLIAYYGNEKSGRSLDVPIGTIPTKDRFAVINGEYMRMITVEECRVAMGFPKGYILPPKRPDAIKMLGNAVPPPLAKYVVGSVAQQLKQGGNVT